MELKKKKENEHKMISEYEKQMLKEEWERETELNKMKELQNIQKQK